MHSLSQVRIWGPTYDHEAEKIQQFLQPWKSLFLPGQPINWTYPQEHHDLSPCKQDKLREATQAFDYRWNHVRFQTQPLELIDLTKLENPEPWNLSSEAPGVESNAKHHPKPPQRLANRCNIWVQPSRIYHSHTGEFVKMAVSVCISSPGRLAQCNWRKYEWKISKGSNASAATSV